MIVKSKAVIPDKVAMLSHEGRKTFMRYAKEVCVRWKADLLDCSKDFRRQRLDIEFEEMINKFDEGCSSYLTIMRRDTCGENYLEICWNTMSSRPDYFIWIYLKLDQTEDVKDFIIKELETHNEFTTITI